MVSKHLLLYESSDILEAIKICSLVTSFPEAINALNNLRCVLVVQKLYHTLKTYRNLNCSLVFHFSL